MPSASRRKTNGIRTRRRRVRRLNREYLEVYPGSREPPARVDPEPEGAGAARQHDEDPGRDRRPEGQGRRDLADADGRAVRVRAPGRGGPDEGQEGGAQLGTARQADE